jgi:hypothetical protein
MAVRRLDWGASVVDGMWSKRWKLVNVLDFIKSVIFWTNCATIGFPRRTLQREGSKCCPFFGLTTT